MQYRKSVEEDRSGRGLGGTGDTRTSTLGSSPGTRAVKAVSVLPSLSENSPELISQKTTETETSQSLEESGMEDLFNSTFRLTPDRVWKPKKSDASKSCESPFQPVTRQRSAPRGNKRRLLSLDQEGQAAPVERKVAIVRSRRIIRTVRTNVPQASVFLGEKCDLLLPPRFKK